MDTLSLSLQAAGSARGAADLRSLSATIRLESLVRIARQLATESIRCLCRREAIDWLAFRARIICRESVSEGTSHAGAGGGLAVLVQRSVRKESGAVVAPRTDRRLCAGARA